MSAATRAMPPVVICESAVGCPSAGAAAKIQPSTATHSSQGAAASLGGAGRRREVRRRAAEPVDRDEEAVRICEPW
jgi:hypothetical protein